MEKKEKSKLQKAWVESAKEDRQTAEGLFKIKRYSGCLFFCQLAIEKALKSVFIEKKDTFPPYTHKLALLANQAGITLNKEEKNYLAEITTFNVEARYDILKDKLYRKANKEYTEKYLDITKKLLQKFIIYHD